MLFDDVLDDGQAQARPLDLAGTAGIGPVKAFKDALLFIFRDADARVADDEESLMAVVADIDVDMAARPVVLDGIIEEVHDHFPEQAAVRPYFRIVHGTVDGDFLFHQDRFHEFYDILNQTAEAQPFGMDLALAVFDAGQVHDFFNHLQEAQGFLADKCAEMDDIVFILENARRQYFGKAADRREGRLQFVRYVGREFPAQLFPVLLFGHVVDDEEHAIEIIIFIDRLDGQQVQSVGPGQFHVTGTVDVLQRIPGYIGQEFLQIALQDVLGLAGAEEMGGPQVETGNAAGLVRQDDAFLEIFHDEAHDIALLFEAAHIVGNGLALQKNLIDQRLQFMVDPRRLHHLHVGVVDLADEPGRLPERAEEARRQQARHLDAGQGRQAQEQQRPGQEAEEMGVKSIPFQTDPQDCPVGQFLSIIIEGLGYGLGIADGRPLAVLDGLLDFRPGQVIFHDPFVIVRFKEDIAIGIDPGNAQAIRLVDAEFLQIQGRILPFLDRRLDDVHGHDQFLLYLVLRGVPEEPRRNEQGYGHTGQPHGQQAEVDFPLHTFPPMT